MIEVRQTVEFGGWLDKLTDRQAVERIAIRIVRLQAGLMGDAKSLGGGIFEARIDHGPGYRLYFTQRGQILIVLLCGGDKKSQRKDIGLAPIIAASLEC